MKRGLRVAEGVLQLIGLLAQIIGTALAIAELLG